jgi:hypothetical protein
MSASFQSDVRAPDFERSPARQGAIIEAASMKTTPKLLGEALEHVRRRWRKRQADEKLQLVPTARRIGAEH